MSMLQIHAAALQSTPTAYHEFLLKYKPNESVVYGFVEGKEDPMFYRGLIEQALPKGWEIELIKAGNRDTVLKSHADFDWARYSTKQICFFIDRDLTDFIGPKPAPIDNIYITDGYSIENEALNFGTYRRLLEEVFNLSSLAAPDVEKLRLTFNRNIEVFREALSPVMAEIILWRQAGLRPNLNNIDVRALFEFVNGDARIRAAYTTPDQRAAHAAQCVGLPASPAATRQAMEIDFLKLQAAERFVRGKYALWFVVESATRIHESIHVVLPAFNAPPKLKTTIGTGNAMLFVAPRLRCPESLREFIARTFLAFASPPVAEAAVRKPSWAQRLRAFLGRFSLRDARQG